MNNQSERLPRNSYVWLLECVAIVLVGLIAYANTFHAPFVLDDIPGILEKPALQNGNPGQIWDSSPHTRFIACLTLALNYRVGKYEVVGYHMVNLGIHLINSILIFLLAQAMFRTPIIKQTTGPDFQNHGQLIAFMAALLFVSHPIQTQAVTYIIQRVASLATLFYLTSLFFYIKGRLSQIAGSGRTPIIFYFSFALLATILAMLTKEIAFTLPIALVLVEACFFTTRLRALTPKLLLFLPFFLAIPIVAWIVLPQMSWEMLSSMTSETQDISRWHYLLTQSHVICTYLRLFILPVHQNLDYDYPIAVTFWELRTAACCLVTIALVSLTAWFYAKNRLLSFGLFFFFVALSVESSFIPIRDVIFEHRLYLPMVGLVIASAIGIFLMLQSLANQLSKRSISLKPQKVFVILTLIFTVMGTVMTYRRNLVWQSATTLWEDTVRKSPLKARPHNNLGVAYEMAAKYQEAIECYQTAIRIKPNWADAYNNLGNAYQKMELYPEALATYRKTLTIDPNYYKAWLNLGIVYRKGGQYAEALKSYQQALAINPKFELTYYNMGLAYEKSGHLNQAIDAYQKALTLVQDLAEAYNNLGGIYCKRQEYQQAILAYNNAIKARPGWAVAHYNLGMVYLLKDQIQNAVAQWEIAVSLDPNYQLAREGLTQWRAYGGNNGNKR